MAESLLSTAGKKLTEVVGRELSLYACARHELGKLRDTSESIRALLADAEGRQAEEESVRLWLSRVRGVAYDIDDVLDDWVMSGHEVAEAERDDDDDDDDDDWVISDFVDWVRACWLSPCTALDRVGSCLPTPLGHVASRYTIARRITEIRKRLDHIHGEKNRYSFSISSGDGQRQLMSKRPDTGHAIEEVMIGRDQDKAEIIKRLECGSSSENGQVQVIAIVGIAGLGKTTLAREIYNDSISRKDFGLFAWVCVTEVFNVANVIKAILHSLKENTITDELSPLQEQLREKLDGKRFLVVLDDVWNKADDKWKTLRASLTTGAAGSRILVTTRSPKVANIMNAVYSRQLQGLSDDDSWRLFSSRAFAERNDKDHSDFKVRGTKIVSKCKGVPLSIKVMGSAMNGKMSVEDWQHISESKMWSLSEAKSEILPALWLSYYNLPPHLKPCFAYCSIFPKDTVMEKDRLVKLWVAQGFVHAQENREVEDIAAEYFDHLLERSMFQEASDDRSSCKIHDLLHDLAEHITKDETCVYVGEKPNQCRINVRHASFNLTENDLDINLISLCGAKTLRTLFLPGYDRIDTGLNNIFLHARFLRALDFRSAEIKTLPRTIGNLKHLRYLDLSESWIVALPNVIGKMKYLKYLNLSNSKLFELPNAIGNLKHLTYLDLSGSEIVELPNAIGNLKHLTYLDLSGSKIAELPNAIGNLNHLTYLDLSDLEIMELPDSLTHLRNLHTLNLNHCFKLKKLPTDMGGMARLRYLEIEDTYQLEHLPKGMGRMTYLKRLCKFIVGGEGGCEINELKQLNDLQGNLTIEHLERVPSRREAMKAELWKKKHLHKLVLKMSSDSDEEDAMLSDSDEDVAMLSDRSDRDEEVAMLSTRSERDEEVANSGRHDAKKEWMDEQLVLEMSSNRGEEVGTSGRYDADSVLEGLRPHENLNELKLVCNGRTSKLPSWLEDSSFVKLTKLEIEGVVIRCEQSNLGGLGKLPALKYLEMWNVDVKKLGREWYYGNSNNDVVARGIKMAFPKLEKLELANMPELEEWELILELDEDVHIMPHLSDLRICYCPKLKGLPHHLVNAPLKNLMLYDCQRLKGTGCSSSFPLLETFTLFDRSEFLSSGLPHLPKLKKFYMENETISNEGWERLLILRKLSISSCSELKSLPDGLTQLSSLEYLEISNCCKIESLPEGLGQLKKLRSLKLRVLQSLTYLPDSLEQLESLEHLRIFNLVNLRSLPEGLGQLKKLKSLKFHKLQSLTYLPDSLGQLESLERLDITELGKLQSLPEEIRELKKLKSLEIYSAEALVCLPNSLAQLESLETLSIIRLKKLESWPEGLEQLKKLKSVVIDQAEALSCLPDSLALLESLEKLYLDGLKKLEFLPERFGQLKKLKSLDIINAKELTCLPDSLGQFESLKHFRIVGLPKLESLPHSLVQLKKLKTLVIARMEGLINIPESFRELESLKELNISSCGKLKSLPNSFGQLKSLTLDHLQAMTCLPNTLQQLKSLQELQICGWKELKSLPPWLVQLKALKKLEIADCIALSSLPLWLKDLPLLQELTIQNCPQLSEWYEKEGGNDLPKILQIPIIGFDGNYI